MFENKNNLAPLIISSGITLAAVLLVAYLVFGSCRARLLGNSAGSQSAPFSVGQPGADISNQANAVATNKDNTIQISDVSGNDPTIAEVVKKVSNHIALPDGRVGVVTISDVDQLKKENPIFYRFARPGNKAILYPDRAILYDPELDRVLDIWHVVEKINP